MSSLVSSTLPIKIPSPDTSLPWRAQAFLDDATTRVLLRRVGGGYSFIHRRLQGEQLIGLRLQ